MCKVSVITPIYNVEKYLSECLESLHRQSLQDIEFICINDGSSDGSLSILEAYAKRDKRFRIINQSNGGYGKAMNAGLDAAKGEYVGILESDDFAESIMYEQLYEIARKTRVDIIKADYYQYIAGENLLFHALPSLPRNKIFSPSEYWEDAPYKSIWTGLYNRSMLIRNEIRFNETPGASYQDTSFLFKCFACAKSAYMTDAAYVHYRVDNEDSSSNNSGKVFCICDEYYEIELFLNEHLDLNDELLFLAQKSKFDDYSWNYNRIADKFRYSFLERIRLEFVQAEQKNLLVKKYWRIDAWEKLQLLLRNPEQFMYQQLCVKNQNYALLNTAFWMKVNKYRHVYLYGAGQVAKRAILYFKQHGLQIESFFVSTMQGNEQEVFGRPVCLFCPEFIDLENSLVIVAVSEQRIWPIVERLLHIDGLNILSLNKDIRKSLGF